MTLAFLIVTPFSTHRGWGQKQQSTAAISPLTYDVASIRRFDFSGNSFQMRIMNTLHSARFQASGVTVKMLLHLAYAVQEDQIQGGPGWISTDLYEIDARSDSAADARLKSMPDEEARKAKESMLQALLADRFNLRIHRVARVGSVYALVVTKAGSKLKQSAPEVDTTGTSTGNHFSVQVDKDTMIFHQTPIHFFVDFLSQQTQQEIVDKTGLTGDYDFRLRFHQERPGDTTSADDFDSNSPAIRDALPEQLGLKLESQKGQVEMLVIDQIAKPSPN
jgi:uncharacterized protein (TIGR03435 family)